MPKLITIIELLNQNNASTSVQGRQALVKAVSINRPNTFSPRIVDMSKPRSMISKKASRKQKLMRLIYQVEN